jgi:hypothetical protein
MGLMTHSQPVKTAIMAAIFATILGLSTTTNAASMTGGCFHTLVNGTTDYMTFELSNVGNGIATNLIVTSELSGASTFNPVQNISSINSDKSAALNFFLYNFSLPGSYAEGFVVQYTQSGVTQFAVFPCILNVSQQTIIEVYLAGTSFSNGEFTATMFNIGEMPINANVSVLAPPGFQVSPKIHRINIQPGLSEDANFNVLFPQNALLVNGSYPLAIMFSYVRSNIHYASYFTTLITHSIGSEPGNNSTTIPTIPANQILGPTQISICIFYWSLRGVVFVIALALALLGSIMYAISNVGGGDFKISLKSYGTDMMIGGVVAILIAELVPYLLSLMFGNIFFGCF